MDEQLKSTLESSIFEATGDVADIVSFRSVSGGCINQAMILQLADGRKYFTKTNSNCPADLFEREAEGLAAIASANTIKVPSVVGYGNENGILFLILEHIKTSVAGPSFFEEFGRQLALLHKSVTNEKFGFVNSNYIGSTVQPNDWSKNWIDFCREHRLGFQFKLARQNGLADGQFNRMADAVLRKLDRRLETDESPALVHGDLWSGNFMTGGDSKPVLIDPAVYFGHREAEFGMTTLFGGFTEDFYRAYNETWPLPDGSEERIELYRLYHILNHLNLFGHSYLSGCVEIMKKYC